MRNVYVVADNIYSPLGQKHQDQYRGTEKGKSGIQLHVGIYRPDPYYASLFDAHVKAENERQAYIL